MAIFKCKMCGGQLEITEGTSVCTCEYCGTEQTLPRLDSDKKANLYDRANHFRRNNDFDKAMSIYEQILNEDSTDAEAYWSLVICRYGIEYVEDPASHKRIPTVNRAQYTSIYADENYKAALQYADALQKSVYEQEAKAIDEIQKGILAISEKEEPFDVFICYKETDENGRRTVDSVLANDLYHQLTQEGFKVFFAKITLEDKLGQEYEPYIFAALNSSKVMVTLGTKPEYFKAVWVKNEWSRYLALIKNGEKKMLIPAYKDMDPYDLPEEFSHLQALDMSKLGFMQDLIRGIKKIIGAEQEKKQTAETVVVTQQTLSSNVVALLKRGNMALEDGEWEKADEFFEEVLNQEAECAEAYWGKFLAKNQVANSDKLIKKYENKYQECKTEKLMACEADNSHAKEIANKYAVQSFVSASELIDLYAYNLSYISVLTYRQAQKDEAVSIIQNDKLYMRTLQYAKGELLSEITNMMDSITYTLDERIKNAKQEDKQTVDRITASYKMHISEADKKAQELYEAAIEKCENSYQAKVKDFDKAKEIEEYKAVKAGFQPLSGYKEAYKYIKKCDDRIAEIEKQEEEKLAKLREKKKKKRKRIIKFTVALVAILLIMVGGLFFYVTKIYPKHVAEQNLKKAKHVAEQNFKKEMNVIRNASEGDIVTFGSYDGGNEWIVLEKQDDKALILSKNLVAKKSYNYNNQYITNKQYTEWSICSLRKWMNSEFLNKTFSNSEQKVIISSDVVNKANPIYETSGGADTQDTIFLLSIDEYLKYENIISVSLLKSWWWLRSPGLDGSFAAYVNSDGSAYYIGFNVKYDNIGVRPALWINLEP